MTTLSIQKKKENISMNKKLAIFVLTIAALAFSGLFTSQAFARGQQTKVNVYNNTNRAILVTVKGLAHYNFIFSPGATTVYVNDDIYSYKAASRCGAISGQISLDRAITWDFECVQRGRFRHLESTTLYNDASSTPTPISDTPGPTFTPNIPSTPGPTFTPNIPSTPGPTFTPNIPSTPGPTFTPNIPSMPGPTFTPNIPSTPGPTFTPYIPSTPGPTFTPYIPSTSTLIPTFMPTPTASIP
jgi:hypothetical protein